MKKDGISKELVTILKDTDKKASRAGTERQNVFKAYGG